MASLPDAHIYVHMHTRLQWVDSLQQTANTFCSIDRNMCSYITRCYAINRLYHRPNCIVAILIAYIGGLVLDCSISLLTHWRNCSVALRHRYHTKTGNGCSDCLNNSVVHTGYTIPHSHPLKHQGWVGLGVRCVCVVCVCVCGGGGGGGGYRASLRRLSGVTQEYCEEKLGS